MESSKDSQLAKAVIVIEDDELEWNTNSIKMMRISEDTSIVEVTEKTAGLTIDRESKVDDPIRLVFTNAEILGLIIKQVLYYRHPNKPINFRKSIQQLRLVSKNFLLAVTQTLRQQNEILFYLTLDETNSLYNAPLVTEEFGKSLDNFVDWVYPDSTDSHSWYKTHRPIFSLKIMEEFFQEENHESLLDCLLKCGDDLQKLEIFLPRKLFKCMFPKYTLTALEKLTVHLGGPVVETGLKMSLDNYGFDIEHNDNTFCLINSLLTASSKLKRLKLENIKTKSYSGIRNELDLRLILPQSIVKLELDLKMSIWDLQILLENYLPNLTSLKMALPEGTISKELVWNFLNPFQITLQELQIVEFEELKPRFSPFPLAFPAIIFPKMEKLKSLEVSATNATLFTNAVKLSSNFPALESIKLAQQQAEYQEWTKSSNYFGVNTVQLELVKKQKCKIETMPISRENMELLHSAFPNVKRLTLKITDELKDGLQYLFGKMTNLQFLKLCIVNTSVKNSDYWDALLIGTTEENLANLTESPEVIVETNDLGSLRMLTELGELHLSATVGCPDISLISDLAFVHAFLKMPKLYKLTLEGGFSASDEMCDVWKNQYKCVSYAAK